MSEPKPASGQLGPQFDSFPASFPVKEADNFNQPKRVMGFRDLVLFYVVTGVSLRWIATAAAAGPSSIVIWIGAWLVFYIPLAFSVVEMSSRYPDEGGLYVWSKKAFGDFSGFMSAWAYWTSNLPYFPAVLYFAASNVIYMRQNAWGHLSNDATFYIIFSLLTLTLATVVNVVGLNVGKWLHNLGAISMWIPAVIVIVMGGIALHRFGSANAFTLHTMTPSLHFKDVIFWSLLVFAFGGCETASFLGRAKGHFDTEMMLAVIHHLLLSSQIPMDRIAALCANLTTRNLIVEWVPPTDVKFRELVRGREALCGHITEIAFREAFLRHFTVARECRLANGRVLLHLRKR